MLAVTVAIAVRRYNAELADAARELRTLDLLLAAETARSFQSVELVLDNVAEQIGARGRHDARCGGATRLDPGGARRSCSARVAGVPQLDAVTIISAAGKLVNFSRGWPIPDVRLDDRDYFRALRDRPDKLFLSEPVINRGSGTPTLYLARRLSAADGTFLGLALGALELSSLRAALCLAATRPRQRHRAVAPRRRAAGPVSHAGGGPAPAGRRHHGAGRALAQRLGRLRAQRHGRRRTARDAHRRRPRPRTASRSRSTSAAARR